ncbi:hypothetical protein ACVWYN_001840 [Pedobacter sp. UYP24]
MKYIVVVLFLMTIVPCLAQTGSLSTASSEQSFFLTSSALHGGNSNWQMEKVSKAQAGGEIISTIGYNSIGWKRAVVPGTILTSLIEDKTYPDPYWGDVNRRTNNIIPDIADAGRDFYHYWYRTGFTLPASFKGKRIWIKLHGINYKSEVWFNGEKLGNLNGMFNTRSFDVTELINSGKQNVIAVNVSPVDITG